MARFLDLTLFLMVFVCPIYAKDLGKCGSLFPIKEESLIKHIKSKIEALSPEEINFISEKMKDKFIEMVNASREVVGIGEAVHYKVYYFDPTVSVQQDIIDHEENVVIKKGTEINPLNQVPFSEPLIFFDETQESHKQWAREQGGIWILTKGKPIELEKSEGRPVYFDQFGVITKKFNIKNVPARVSKDGLKLKIEEIPVENNK